MNIGKLPLLCTLLLTMACSGGDDGAASEGSDGGGETGGVDAGEASSCAETPTRLIVLGDSITACVGVGGKDAGTCGPKILHDSLAAGYAPGLSYENLAVSGAVTTNVVDSQLATITTGTAGHAVVLIYVGGNDLQRYLLQPDAAAEAGLAADLPGIIEDWNSIFAFFNDATNFPDGATIIMNNQYNPFDDCTAPPYNLSAAKSELLGDYNVELSTLADSQVNAFLTDQHTPYLGHGHHYNVSSCPYYQAGLEPFMADLIHPNAAGHANLATQWDTMADSLYGDCE